MTKDFKYFDIFMDYILTIDLKMKQVHIQKQIF